MIPLLRIVHVLKWKGQFGFLNWSNDRVTSDNQKWSAHRWSIFGQYIYYLYLCLWTNIAPHELVLEGRSLCRLILSPEVGASKRPLPSIRWFRILQNQYIWTFRYRYDTTHNGGPTNKSRHNRVEGVKNKQRVSESGPNTSWKVRKTNVMSLLQ